MGLFGNDLQDWPLGPWATGHPSKSSGFGWLPTCFCVLPEALRFHTCLRADVARSWPAHRGHGNDLLSLCREDQPRVPRGLARLNGFCEGPLGSL